MTLQRHYRRLALSDVDLGFAGRSSATHPVHRAIASLTVGAALALRRANDRWEIIDREVVVVGRLARAFAPPAGMRCALVSVDAVIRWRRNDTEPEYQDRLRCDQWEVVLPELVFEPDTNRVQESLNLDHFFA